MTGFLALVAIWALRSTGVVTVAALVQLAIRNRSAATKNLVWRTAIVAVALLPALSLFTPAIKAPITAPVIPAEAVVTPTPHGAPDLSVISNATQDSPPIMPVVLYNVYALGFLAFLARWVAGIVAFRRIFRSAERQEPSIWIARDESLSVPITFGFWSPVVLLPAGSVDWPEARVRAAVAHELAHIDRRDWGFQSFGTIVAALQWFNPAIWLAVAGMTSTAEEAADDAVLKGGIQASSYAGALLDVAAGLTNVTQPGVAMVRSTAIRKRLARLVAANVNRESPSLAAFAGIAVLFLLCTGTAGAVRLCQTQSGAIDGDWGSLFYPAPPAVSVTFAAGKHADLVKLRDIEGGRVRWWASDGKPLTVRQEEDNQFPHPMLSGTQSDHRLVAFQFVLSGLESNDPKYRIKIDNGVPSGAITISGNEYRPVVDLPRSAAYADVSLGVSAEPYMKLYTTAPNNGNLVLGSNQFDLPDGAVSRLYLSSPEAQVNMDYQAIAHLRNGKLLPAYGHADGIVRVQDLSAWPVDFQCRLADIARVDLLSRSIEWIKFERINLYPSHEQ